MQPWKAREAICEIGRRLWQRGYVAANDGNISVRLEEDRLLTTPTGVSKGFMEADKLLVVDRQGKVLHGEGKPSSELPMHLEIYRLRPEVRAVVHAHPPVATAFSVAGIALDKCVLPESVVVLGAVPIAPYATPWTEEVPRGLKPIIPQCDAVLLENHGAVTWAEDLDQAYFKMETLEMTAQVTHHALALGSLNVLDPAQVEKLMRLRDEKKVPGRLVPCVAEGTCADSPNPGPDREELIQAITRQVLGELNRKP
jgi:L-fuculose-phosphate aldolase